MFGKDVITPLTGAFTMASNCQYTVSPGWLFTHDSIIGPAVEMYSLAIINGPDFSCLFPVELFPKRVVLPLTIRSVWSIFCVAFTKLLVGFMIQFTGIPSATNAYTRPYGFSPLFAV